MLNKQVVHDLQEAERRAKLGARLAKASQAPNMIPPMDSIQLAQADKKKQGLGIMCRDPSVPETAKVHKRSLMLSLEKYQTSVTRSLCRAVPKRSYAEPGH